MLSTPLGEMEPAPATAAIPISMTDSARVGEECGAPWPRPDDWKDCPWYQSYNKQADGSCACEFSVQHAGGRVLLAPGLAVVRMIDPRGEKLGWGGINVAIPVSAVVWLGIGWWLWSSRKGGK